MKIGTVAERAGVGVETVRYYERRGLIREPPRRPSGHRDFPERTVARIRFIKRAQELGCTLKEVKTLLSLRAAPDSCCEEVRKEAKRKIEEIQRKIDDLRRMKATLVDLRDACEKRKSMPECPILDALGSDE